MATMTTSATAKLFAVLIAATTLTGLTACSGESDPTETTGSSPGSGEESTSDGSDDEDDSDDPSCLVGDWVATDSGLEGWYRGFVPDDVLVNGVQGEILISFSDTDFIYSTRALAVSMTIADQDVVTRMTGGVAGTYGTLPGGIMSTSIDSSDLDGIASVSGISISASELGLDLSGAGAFVGYECTGGTLILENQSAGTGTTMIELEPAG